MRQLLTVPCTSGQQRLAGDGGPGQEVRRSLRGAPSARGHVVVVVVVVVVKSCVTRTVRHVRADECIRMHKRCLWRVAVCVFMPCMPNLPVEMEHCHHCRHLTSTSLRSLGRARIGQIHVVSPGYPLSMGGCRVSGRRGGLARLRQLLRPATIRANYYTPDLTNMKINC